VAEINVTVEMRDRPSESATLLMTPSMRQELQTLQPVERSNASDLPKLMSKRFGHEEWASVCERIQDAAEYIQEIEAGRHQQELQAQKIFANMRDEIASANARALAAERMMQDMQQRANSLVKNLEDKLQAAEERARESEEWLSRISEAVRSNLNFP
jgi:hypothetical protein